MHVTVVITAFSPTGAAFGGSIHESIPCTNVNAFTLAKAIQQAVKDTAVKLEAEAAPKPKVAAEKK